MAVVVWLAVALVIMATYFIIQRVNGNTKSKLPPGPPRRLPIFGDFFFMMDCPLKYLQHATKTYGGIFTIRVGRKSIVVLSKYETMAAALKLDAFQGRTHTQNKRLGLITSDGVMWKMNRKLFLNTLLNLSNRSKQLEHRMNCEIENVKNVIDAQIASGRNFLDMQETMSMMTGNIICWFLFGKTFDYDDKIMRNTLNNIRSIWPLLYNLRFQSNVLPWSFPFVALNYRRVNKLRSEIDNFAIKMIEEVKERQDVDDGFYARIYLNELENCKRTKTGERHFFQSQMEKCCGDILLAGTDTSQVTILWALHFMAIHQDIQKLVQKEMDDVIGRTSLPSSSDKTRLPFTTAVLQEVERMSSIAPFSVLHMTKEDVRFKSWLIPKNTIVLCNLYALHHDDDVWKEPHKFLPSRFIDADGNVSRPEYLTPFGVGRRSCMGEKLAMTVLFLSFTTLLHNYHFDIRQNQHLDQVKSDPSFITNSPSTSFVITKRLS